MLVRAISALFGVSGLVAAWYFFASSGLVVVSSLVTFIACIEFSKMVEPNSAIVRSLFVAITFAFFLIFTFYSQSFISYMCLFILLSAYFILCVDEGIKTRIEKLTSWTVGALYCGGFTGVVVHGILQKGGNFFTALLVLSFLTDTFAYLGGRLLGKRPLAPKISPKKTIEGSAIGLIGGSLVGFLFLQSIQNTSPQWILALTCVAASLFTQVGDLFESALKRYSGVKDSGKILPGHGGILDRIDGLLFAGPVVFLWMQNYT